MLFTKIRRYGPSSTNTGINIINLLGFSDTSPTAQEVEFYSSTLSEDTSPKSSRSLDESVGFEHEYAAAVPSRLREFQVYLEPPEVDQQSWGVMENMLTGHDPGGQHLDSSRSERYQHTRDTHKAASPEFNKSEVSSKDAQKQIEFVMAATEKLKAAERLMYNIFSLKSVEIPQNDDPQIISYQTYEQPFATYSTTNSRRNGIKPASAADLLKTVSAARTTKKFERSIARLSHKLYEDVMSICTFGLGDSELHLQDDFITLHKSITLNCGNKFWDSPINSIDGPLSVGTKNLGLETVEKLVNGGRPESLAEVYCFLAVCYAMSQCDIAPQRSLDRPQVVAGIRMLRRCIYIPQNPEATNKQRRLFDIITDVFFKEFECALNWLKHNGPEGILERLGQSAGLSGAMEDILNRRSKDRVPPDLSHSGVTFGSRAKQKPPEAVDDDDLGPPSWLELSVLPIVQVLNDIATTLQDIGLGFFCFIALLYPALVIQTSSEWGGAAKHDPVISSIMPQVEVIGTPSGVAPFPSPSPSVYMPVPASWDDAPAEMDEMEYLPFVEPIADVQALYQTDTENFASDPLSLISPTDVEFGTISSDSLSTDDRSDSTTPINKETPSTSSSQSRPRATRPNNGHIVCTHPGCTKRFKHKNNLYRHKKTHHASNDHSGASSSSSAVAKPPQDQKWQCLFCKAKRGTARGRENIEQHMKDEHAQELERYKRGLLGQSLMFYAGMSQG